MQNVSELAEKHERLKKRIHNFRIPLSKNGQRVMFVVYFSIPIVVGYNVMQWAIGKSAENLGAEGELLKSRQNNEYSKYTDYQNKQLQRILNRAKNKNGDLYPQRSQIMTETKSRQTIHIVFRMNHISAADAELFKYLSYTIASFLEADCHNGVSSSLLEDARLVSLLPASCSVFAAGVLLTTVVLAPAQGSSSCS